MTDTAASTFRDRFTLLREAQKRRTGVPLYTLAVNRPVGRVIAAASPRGITPNHLTGIGALFTFAGILYLLVWADGSPWSALVGVALVVGFFFDSADGQLARLRGGGSASGEWLDHVIDGVRIVLLHIATLAFLLRTEAVPTPVAFALCTVFVVAASATFFSGSLFEKLTTSAPSTRVTSGSRLRSALMLPVDYGVTCWIFLLTAWVPVFVVVYALAALAKVGTTTMLLSKWYRTLRREDRERRAAAA
ncbi:MAG: CDP-alcohol phosphatidyltransferase family protein [Candidatus Microbacterium phytovorans]|uniref:CDP-alcohol phosphatidyltransferase family protein n=1 Tax=Candidatus Microbacterium phytovorans TaxID=3121374 RepID=A0AAJ6B3P9_9MICO|nr:CDP-alcohol phosphatidyltransferase family protein [Microbacterium sp.]WEK13372.1 MAG: CDP-alcohol phosphatidyltransferase family protein [Microbacterium sp.]